MSAADGHVIIRTAADNSQLEKDLAKTTKSIEKMEKQIDDMTQKRATANERSSILGAAIEGDMRKLQALKDHMADLQARAKDKTLSPDAREAAATQIPAVRQDVSDQQARVRQLQTEWNKVTGAVERYDAKLSEATGELRSQKAAAGQLEEQIRQANGPVNSLINGVGKRIDKLDYARAAGKSIGDTKMQVGYLVKELKSYGLWEALNASKSVREASDIIMLQFEKPASIYTADREKSLEKRAGFGLEYYEKYAKRGGTGGMKYTAANPPMQCFMRQSTWHKSVGTTPIRGVLWHSTGANNPYISRYVQPDDNDPNRDKIIAILGRNRYNNDWNHQQLKKGVHAFIGKLTSGEVSAVQVGPWNKKAWGCGPGKKGSCNSGWIQFEICEDGLDDPDYFQAVYQEAVELTAYLCKIHGLDPKGTVNFCGVKAPVILCHQDSYRIGLGGNHGDVYTWFNRYGKTMDDVRNDVATLLAGAENGKEEDDMTKAEVLEIIKEYEAQRDAARAQAGPSDWSKAARAWAESNGIISGTGAGMQYKATCTREQVVQLLYRAAHLLERK